MNRSLLVLEHGKVFRGFPVGKEGIVCGDIVFNTSMFGYQEVITDPSYAQQIITFTCPHIGNVGVNKEDQESKRVWASGIVLRNLSLRASNWRSEYSLNEYLMQQNVVGISHIDTRHLTQILRDEGAQSACIMTKNACEAEAFDYLAKFIENRQTALASVVTTNVPYSWTQKNNYKKTLHSRRKNPPPYHIVVYDYGVKYSILKQLADLGCRVTVVASNTSLISLNDLSPNGIILSNGPGDPRNLTEELDIIRYLIQNWTIPILGVCLGHQLIALASAAKVYHLKFGHHGTNHPVKDMRTNKIYITSQNHEYAVDSQALPAHTEITHVSLFDGTIQGIKRADKPIWGFQGHPEAGPGPDDMVELFQEFLKAVEDHWISSTLKHS